jgi:hypothetical protein
MQASSDASGEWVSVYAVPKMDCPSEERMIRLILPTNDGHPVKRVNYATEVNHDKTIRKEKNIPEAAFAGIQEGSFGTGGKNQHTEGRQGAGAS